MRKVLLSLVAATAAFIIMASVALVATPSAEAASYRPFTVNLCKNYFSVQVPSGVSLNVWAQMNEMGECDDGKHYKTVDLCQNFFTVYSKTGINLNLFVQREGLCS